MTAPDRIWADWDKMYPEQNGGQWWGEKCNAIEYVRADLARTNPLAEALAVPEVAAAAQLLLDDLARAIPQNGDLGDVSAAKRWAKAHDAAENAPTMIGRATPIQMIRAALRAIGEGKP